MSTPGIWTWVAPNADADLSNFEMNIDIISGSGGGSGGGIFRLGGAGGAGGSFASATLQVIPGKTYTFTVGANGVGGAGVHVPGIIGAWIPAHGGTAGGLSSVRNSTDSTTILTCNGGGGGSPGTVSGTSTYRGAGGTVGAITYNSSWVTSITQKLGGVGGVGSDHDIDSGQETYAGSGGNVSPYVGGTKGTDHSGTWTAGAGSGASAYQNGARGGNAYAGNTSNNAAGGAGGSSHLAGYAGSNAINYYYGGGWTGAAGGSGRDGRIVISFTLIAGQGSTPPEM